MGLVVDKMVDWMVYVGETMSEWMTPRSEASSEESTRLVGELESGDGLSAEFTRFVRGVEPRLSYAFFAAYGPEVGSDVTADCLIYAWEHWSRIQEMGNAAGYLFRVGQSKARGYLRPRVSFPQMVRSAIPEVEPKLPGALERLTQNQRLAVVLVHGLGWTEEETATLIGRSRSTVRTHLERGLRRLRDELGVSVDA